MSDFGRVDAPGVRSGENFAGAGGPGQFLAGTWRIYGVDGDSDGAKDRYSPADAIPGTANLLSENGAPADYRRAVFAYNHASGYFDDVLARAARDRGAAEADPDAAEAIAVADASATAACTELVGAGGQADLNRAVRLTFPVVMRPWPEHCPGHGHTRASVGRHLHGDRDSVGYHQAPPPPTPGRLWPWTTLCRTAAAGQPGYQSPIRPL
jgi:Transglycosylase SLT domain